LLSEPQWQAVPALRNYAIGYIWSSTFFAGIPTVREFWKNQRCERIGSGARERARANRMLDGRAPRQAFLI